MRRCEADNNICEYSSLLHTIFYTSTFMLRFWVSFLLDCHLDNNPTKNTTTKTSQIFEALGFFGAHIARKKTTNEAIEERMRAMRPGETVVAWVVFQRSKDMGVSQK